MDSKSGKNSGKKNAGEDRVNRGDLHLGEDDVPERLGESGDAEGKGGCKGSHPARRRCLFMQRNQSADDHSDQTAEEEMHYFFTGLLNLFGMFVDPVAGKRFQGVYVGWQIV